MGWFGGLGALLGEWMPDGLRWSLRRSLKMVGIRFKELVAGTARG